MKEQKEQSKSKKTKVESSPEEVESASTEKTTRSGLPALLPMDILESVAEMDGQEGTNNMGADSKKRKHMRPEDFALMELEAELKAEAAKRKKAEKTQKNVGYVSRIYFARNEIRLFLPPRVLLTGVLSAFVIIDL